MSLWRLEDKTARAWMKALYRARFIDGMSTEESVKQANLHLLNRRRAQRQSTHPYYWSGFVASGDWH